MSRPDHAALMAQLSTALHDERHEEPTVAEILRQAGTVVPEADHVSITVRARRGTHRTLGSSSELAEQADELQYRLREGPCLEASLDGHGWFRSGLVRDDPRWPLWGPRAADLGVGSLMSVQLLAQGAPYGAVNMYAEQAARFTDPDEVDRALLWATHVGGALAAAQTVSGLETAMTSRLTIGMAIGRVMERYGLPRKQAFDLLHRLASHRNEKLRDVAQAIVDDEIDPRSTTAEEPQPAG